MATVFPNNGDRRQIQKITRGVRRSQPLHFQTTTTTFHDRYAVVQQLGNGNSRYGPTHLCVAKHDRSRRSVVKSIPKTYFHRIPDARIRSRVVHSIYDQMLILSTVRHPQVAGVLSVVEERDSIHVVTEELSGGSLFDRFSTKKVWTEQSAARIIKQVLSALDYMHRDNNMVHNHLSPKKIHFLSDSPDDDLIKITGFGMAKVQSLMMKHDATNHLLDAPYWTAPELLPHRMRSKSSNSSKSKTSAHAADMWSVGVILFFMIFGCCPFSTDPSKYGTEQRDDIYKAIRKGLSAKHFPDHIGASDSVKDLILRLLRPKSKKRLTAKAALKHSWIINVGETEDTEPTQLVTAEDSALGRFHNLCRYKSTVRNLFQSQYQRLKPQHLRELHRLCVQYDTSRSGILSAFQFESVIDELIRSADGLSVDTSSMAEARQKLIMTTHFVDCVTSFWFRETVPDVAIGADDVTHIVQMYMFPGPHINSSIGRNASILTGSTGIQYRGFLDSLTHDYLLYSDRSLHSAMSKMDEYHGTRYQGFIGTSEALAVYRKMDFGGDWENAMEIASALESNGGIDVCSFTFLSQSMCVLTLSTFGPIRVLCPLYLR